MVFAALPASVGLGLGSAAGGAASSATGLGLGGALGAGILGASAADIGSGFMSQWFGASANKKAYERQKNMLMYGPSLAVRGLEAAGLNPILAATGGKLGHTSPPVHQAQAGKMGSTGAAKMLLQAQLGQIRAQTEAAYAQAAKTSFEANIQATMAEALDPATARGIHVRNAMPNNPLGILLNDLRRGKDSDVRRLLRGFGINIDDLTFDEPPGTGGKSDWQWQLGDWESSWEEGQERETRERNRRYRDAVRNKR